MSFYFTLNTSTRFSSQMVFDALPDTDIAVNDETPDEWVFYTPNQSLRGVCVYQMDGKIDIGLNAFTPRVDAELMRDITAAVAKTLNCAVEPEDSDTPISASEVATYCDDGWVRAREGEAGLMVKSILQSKSAPLTLMGYRRAFNIAPSLFETFGSTTASDDVSIADVMDNAIALQEFENFHDIFVPTLMQLMQTPPKPEGMFQRLRSMMTKQSPLAPICVYALPEATRTLVPVSINQLSFFALLGSDHQPHRKVPAHLIIDKARAIGATEFGVGAFDLTLEEADYQSLYASGEPLSPELP